LGPSSSRISVLITVTQGCRANFPAPAKSCLQADQLEGPLFSPRHEKLLLSAFVRIYLEYLDEGAWVVDSDIKGHLSGSFASAGQKAF
jgi:hypothetical protein